MEVANGRGGSRTEDSWLQIQGFLFITLGASVLTLGNLRWSGGQERWRPSNQRLWLFKSFVSLLSLLKWNLIWQPQIPGQVTRALSSFFPRKRAFCSLIGCLMKNHTWLPNLVLFREASTGATQLSLRLVDKARSGDRSLLTWHNEHPELAWPHSLPRHSAHLAVC